MNDKKFFVMKRRLDDGFTLPLAVYNTFEEAKKFIEVEVREKTIEPGYEEYIERRMLDRWKSLGR